MKLIIKLIFWIVGIFLLLHYVFDISLNDVLTLKEKANSSICDEPVKYKVGSIDPKFKITETELLDKIEEASNLWTNAYGKRLFVYDQNSDLEVNLIYDERQGSFENIENMETNVSDKKLSLEEENAIYDQKVAELEKQITELNKQIDYWNSKGGAPEPEFRALTKMQENLNSKIDELNSYANKLNQAVDDVNKNIGTFNNMVTKFNTVLEQKPEVGFYTSGEEKIDIFFYTDDANLVNILAHELGHSLGLDHIEEEGAMMNPIVSETTGIKSADKELVNSFCEENTLFNVTKNRIKYTIDSLISKVSLILK
ncbi:matrixin family metalloprotease [Patescibacteria group bacterium]|nr:matrixin family metalloprotease [Patescibacteria group bacterium]